jgi:hypothetical protein
MGQVGGSDCAVRGACGGTRPARAFWRAPCVRVAPASAPTPAMAFTLPPTAATVEV